MARGNNKDGFSIDSIVKTNPVVSSPETKKRTTADGATSNTLETLIQKNQTVKWLKCCILNERFQKHLTFTARKLERQMEVLHE